MSLSRRRPNDMVRSPSRKACGALSSIASLIARALTQPRSSARLALSFASNADTGGSCPGSRANNSGRDLRPFTLPCASGDLVRHFAGQCCGLASHSSDLLSCLSDGRLLGELHCELFALSFRLRDHCLRTLDCLCSCLIHIRHLSLPSFRNCSSESIAQNSRSTGILLLQLH